jgi:immune inhibitor A
MERAQRVGARGGRRTIAAAAAAIALGWVLGLVGAERAAAVPPAPWLLQRAKGTALEADVQAQIDRWQALRAGGADRVHPQFALSPARYPRGGVARRNILVVLAKFPSDGFGGAVSPASKSTPGYYQRLFFSDDPNDGFISVREYYREASNGRLIVSGRVTAEWLTMPHSYAYYANGSGGLDFGSYPRSSQALAEDAMSAAYTHFDGKLGYFDNDGPDGVSGSGDDDGYIDAVCVIHPGLGAEVVAGSAAYNYLWSHEAGTAIYMPCPGTGSGPGCLPGLVLGSVRGFLYFMVPEYNEFAGDRAIGTYCHEFGHTLGLPDLYDPVNAGLGFYSLMALGNYLPFNGEAPFGSHPGNFDPWCRQYLGFDPIAIPTSGGSQTLGPAAGGGGSLRVWTDGQPGTEYFLLENRKRTGIDKYLPAEGLFVYHVDDSRQDNLSGPSFYRVRVVAADGLADLESDPALSGNYGDDADAWPGTLDRRTWTEATTPDSRAYDGSDTGLRVTNIAGSVSDGSDSVSFDLVISLVPKLDVAAVVYQDGDDDHPDPSETGDITLTVTNRGAPSGALTYTLASLDALVAVTSAASSGAALATGASGVAASPFTVQFGAPTTLPRRVQLRLNWDDGTTSGQTDFGVTIGEATGLTADFETDFTLTGWEPVLPPPSNQWHRTQVRTRSGAYAAKVGSTNPLGVGSNNQQTYRNSMDASLTSPGFYLPPQSQVSFWSYTDTETNGGTGAWDGGRVEISHHGGPWIPLTVDGGYPYQIEFNSGSVFAGSDVFAGSCGGWTRFVADLSAYEGPAQIRFRFVTDDTNDPRDQFGSLVRYYEGWYVDDVAVEARQTPSPTPIRVSFRAGPNPYYAGSASAGRVHFRFTARDGLPHPGERPEIQIYDVKGRLVDRVVASTSPLLPHEFAATWDGRHRSGVPVRAGVYFAQVTLLGETQRTRLVVVR